MSRIYLRLAFLARRAPAILWSDAVAGLEPETVVQLLGDHDLAAHAQLDGSRCFGLCFHISVFYNWREHRPTVCLTERSNVMVEDVWDPRAITIRPSVRL